MARQPVPLVSTRRYAPFILSGGNGLGPGMPRVPSVGWYRVWMPEEGSLTLRRAGERDVQHIAAPCGVVQPPGEGWAVTARRIGGCRILEFDVTPQRLEPRSHGRGYVHAGPSRQPSPMETWGVDIPVVVPRIHLPALKAMLLYCGDQWWRGPFALARANARLAEWLATYAEYHGDVSDGGDDWLTECRRVASRFMYQGITAKRWAELMGMSRQHFTKRFGAESGGSPGTYLDGLRLDEARKLLMAGGLSVKEVAWLCGFRSLSAFSRFFSRMSGESPTAWRAARTHRTPTLPATPPAG